MNDRIAKQIWHDALQCSMKPFSWGLRFNDIKVIENGTSFYVQGKVCGWIKIQLTEDNRYDITITPDNALESEVIYRFVSLENIVSLIDVNVQYGVSYYDYICSIFGLTHKIAEQGNYQSYEDGEYQETNNLWYSPFLLSNSYQFHRQDGHLSCGTYVKTSKQ